MADAFLQIALPVETVEQLQQIAKAQRRSVDEVVRDLVMQELPGLPLLPVAVEAELAAFENLSDDVLWLLAESALPDDRRQELAKLNDAAQQRALSEVEAQRRQELVEDYERFLVRRAQAASLLKERGYDLHRLISP